MMTNRASVKVRVMNPMLQGKRVCFMNHDCFRTLLSTWDEKTKHPQKIVWGDQVRRQTRFFLGGLMGDQQVILTGCFGDSMHNYFQFALLLLICSDHILLYLIVSNFLYCFYSF